MKSLTELIKWLSDLQSDDDQMVLLHENELTDTIHYLTEYHEMLENVENEPLEYEELQRMVGKPIWIEGSSVLAHWMIIADIRPDCLTCHGMLLCRGRFGETIPLYKEYLGKTWLAYKKERVVENGHITSVCD